jgi:hypothetical protein
MREMEPGQLLKPRYLLMNMLEVQDRALIEHSRHSEKNEASQTQSIHHFSGRCLGSRSNTL